MNFVPSYILWSCTNVKTGLLHFSDYRETASSTFEYYIRNREYFPELKHAKTSCEASQFASSSLTPAG
ncbi:jg14852 [Pararge aegeria aegeria]|uniref:Jg14852 protein n=1 Tax=Pararge aegeria aegeria TaxID=348720 RepID=A0A8S4R0V7_9NEOP|nr:jg14852 [Pararge aegeria aegeria]